MSTSGGGAANALGYLVVIVVALVVAGRELRSGGGDLGLALRRPAPTAVVIWLVVAVPSLLQLAVPAVLDALARRPDLIAQGQVWRLLTSVVVQDGGLVGTVSNLVFLYLVACPAARLWGGARTAVLFVLAGIGFDLMATFAYPQFGAGNSGATFALAASLPAAVAVWRRAGWATAAAVLCAVVGAGLLVLGDAHGFAFLGGLVLGVLAATITGRPGIRLPG